MTPAYRYRATVHRVVDADTYELVIDLGFRVYARQTIRLRGVDCPERNTPEGKAATTWVGMRLHKATEIVVETYKDKQTFARWVADVYVDGQSLADCIIEADHVKHAE